MSEIVYLIHLAQPIGQPQSDEQRERYGLPARKATRPAQAQHYIGTTKDLAARLELHKAGQGAALLRAAGAQGIGFDVVRTWPGGRALEKKLKAHKHAARMCPICNPDGWRAHGPK